MRQFLVLLAVTALALPSTACAARNDSAPVTVTQQTTITEASEEEQPPEDPSTVIEETAETTEEETPDVAPPTCGVETSHSAITAPIETLAPPSAPGTYWSYEGDSNFDPCADLSYALLVQQPQGNSQFGTQLLFFHKGEYLGIDSTYPQQVIDIVDGGDRLTVTYKDWEAQREAGAPNAEASKYTATVTFFWDEAAGQLGTEGELPNQGL